jgi:hypothetical protein
MVPLQMLGLVLVAVAALLSQTSTAQSATCYAPSALNFTSAQGALWLNGQPFKLKGTSWYAEPSTTPSFSFSVQHNFCCSLDTTGDGAKMKDG